MPDHRVPTSTCPGPGWGTSTVASSIFRGALNCSRRARIRHLRVVPATPRGPATVACAPLAGHASEEPVMVAATPQENRSEPHEVASAPIPTPYGEFQARAFQNGSGHVHLALVFGAVADGRSLLTRVHSECLTGDALGSLRCDCGVQLRAALRAVAAEGRGIVLYVSGHEGRGIGLVEKLRAYVEQDAGADTVDANLRLGFQPDLRDYGDAAAILRSVGVRSVRLLTNNPGKAAAMRRHGISVDSLQPLGAVANRHNRSYLETKQARFGHLRTVGSR